MLGGLVARARPPAFFGDESMGICPKDFKPCIDDVCYGAGCMKSPYHESVLLPCDGCGGLMEADEGHYCEDCLYEDEDCDDMDY